MLRHYDELGLLMPVSIDRFTGYRYYSEEQLPIVGRISALKDMGFGLAAIGEILKCYDDRETLDRYLHLKQTELAELSLETERRLRLLDTARKRLRKDDNTMEYNVTLKTLPERTVASVRMTIPSYEHEGVLWETLMKETSAMNLLASDPCYCNATFHDSEYRESDVDVEVQKTVRGQYTDTEHVKFKTLPPVSFASATYKGSYSKISEVNAAVAAWVRDNGYEFDGPAFSIYHVSPHETQNPEEYVTEVCCPVKKK
jgi:effector-binding domain-containing protein